MSFKVNIVRSDKTALQIASHQGFTGVVEFLLQMGAIVDLQVSLSKCADQSSSMDQTEKYQTIDVGDDLFGLRSTLTWMITLQKIPVVLDSNHYLQFHHVRENVRETFFHSFHQNIPIWLYNYALLSKYWSSCLLSTGHWRWHSSSLCSIWVSVVLVSIAPTKETNLQTC